MTSTSYFSKPLVTPSILFLVCPSHLIHRAQDVAGLLADACGYQIVNSSAAFEQYMESVEVGAKPTGRILVMPSVANDRAGRTVCYNVLCDKSVPLHATGCIAITDNSFPAVTPDTKLFDPFNQAEIENWISTDFMCVIRSEEEVAELKEFIAVLLPILVS